MRRQVQLLGRVHKAWILSLVLLLPLVVVVAVLVAPEMQGLLVAVALGQVVDHFLQVAQELLVKALLVAIAQELLIKMVLVAVVLVRLEQLI